MTAYKNMIDSTIFSSYGFGEVIIKAAPFILIAVATSFSAKAGLINVGGEGQFAMGALFSTFTAVFLLKDFPPIPGIILMALVGILGGMVWGVIAGLFKVIAGMNETITTLIMNYISYQIVNFFIYGILKDPESFNWPMSAKIASNLRLPHFGNSRVSIAIVISLLIAFAIWFILAKTKWGYKLRVIGGNTKAALHAGFNVGRNQLMVMALSGGLCGLAGMMEIAGVEERLRSTTGVNYGYLGFLAAWMAWNNPLLAILTSLVIAFLSIAGNTLEITTGLPSSAVRILMALVLLAILWKGKGKGNGKEKAAKTVSKEGKAA
jgi:simple sugar transport system permease protein